MHVYTIFYIKIF